MKAGINWIYMHCDKSIVDVNIIDIINATSSDFLDKYIVPKLKYDIYTVKNFSPTDLSNLPADEQYVTLLANIFLVGVKDLSYERVCQYIQWMLSLRNVFEMEWVYYLWHESCLYDDAKYPTFYALADLVYYVDSYETLQFLWDVAKSGDVYLTLVTKEIAKATESSFLTKYFTYAYVCSGVDINVIARFFSDINKLTYDELHTLESSFFMYYWPREVLEELINKKYTIKRIVKYLNKTAYSTLLYPGRVLPIDKVSSFFIMPFRSRDDYNFGVLPAHKSDYKIDYKLWYPGYKYPRDIIGKPAKSVYQIWFESLPKEKLLQFRKDNPIVYKACYEGKYDMVKEVLKSMMEAST